MSNPLIKASILLQDSIEAPPILEDTVVVLPDTVSLPDTSISQLPIIEDTASIQPVAKAKVRDTASLQIIDRPRSVSAEAQAEIDMRIIGDSENQKSTAKSEDKTTVDHFSLFAKSDSHVVAVKPERFLKTNSTQTTSSPGNLEKIIHESKLSHLNWTLLVGLLCVILLLILKSYYTKLTSRIVNTLVNFQLADKMLREKNMIVRRAFFIMNLNYVLVLSLFILLLTFYFELGITLSHSLDYLIINAILIGVLLARLFVYYIAGYLFERLPAVVEHIHMVYLVNKNLGLILLPVSFIAIYTEAHFSEILLFFGIGILAIATVYKLIRGFQIIFRSGVFLFYAILYLCTLEVLPLLLGAKLIISLR